MKNHELEGPPPASDPILSNRLGQCLFLVFKVIRTFLTANVSLFFDDIDFFDTYVEKFIIGMKRKSIFYDLPYWEHIKISHLLDPMHIFKNVSFSL